MSASPPPVPLTGTTGAPATVPPFDQVAVRVAPGQDLVVRLPGVLLVVAVTTAAAGPATAPARPALVGWGPAPVPPAPVAAPTGDVHVGELVGLCRRVSAAGSRAPGRRLHEELHGWLLTVTDPPSFAVAAATEDGLALVLVGGGTAEVPDLGLRLTPAEGEKLDNGTLVLDRFVTWPPAALQLSAGAPAGTAPHPLADLEAGAVPGAAAVLSPAPAPTAAGPVPTGTTQLRLPAPHVVTPPLPPPPPRPAAPAPTPRAPEVLAPPAPPHDHAGHGHGDHADHDHGDHAGHDHAAPPAPVPPPPVELPAPKKSTLLFGGTGEPEPPREPLPTPGAAPAAGAPAAEPEDERPQVKGILCKNGHLNDPRAGFCALCGIRTTQQTAVLVEGPRPPLGLLVFDDGATVSLDMDYLLGREPETDERVASGQLRPLLVVDTTGGVSRHHAEIRLEGWDVLLVDTGSANGTLVAPRGAPGWSSLVPGQPVRLTPGMAVRMGGRQFAFESPHGGF
ncbi:FHA domain-containing protein [Geodermatophilus telluris]|uniref:FHA domain-containing protein n=1 Tax=Geodermatophilus telluris TaxID=1190417 RepID=A0A1G6QQ06_9ACTN|nr:FHA domain-containing protein [Geodermatophilus telluris]SDC94094.1 FHA domain-containing protein [Geodermatophilus telluris]